MWKSNASSPCSQTPPNTTPPADRLSVNIELPNGDALTALAPEKNDTTIKRAMGQIRISLDDARDGGRKAPRFAPAGQSTQMIVGADSSTDTNIIETADTLYRSYGLRRIYYSAFSPFAHSSPRLPNQPPPLMREHRLYQADWLMRYYGFSTDDLKAAIPTGHFDLDLDPKTAWALRHREQFPLDVNTASREQLLRVPRTSLYRTRWSSIGRRFIKSRTCARGALHHQRRQTLQMGAGCGDLPPLRHTACARPP